jgi:hypothetical protein
MALTHWIRFYQELRSELNFLKEMYDTMKKKLLVVLGAGSSIPRGMPSAPDLDKHTGVWAEEWSYEVVHLELLPSVSRTRQGDFSSR